jgi:hypothetical protein
MDEKRKKNLIQKPAILKPVEITVPHLFERHFLWKKQNDQKLVEMAWIFFIPILLKMATLLYWVYKRKKLLVRIKNITGWIISQK